MRRDPSRPRRPLVHLALLASGLLGLAACQAGDGASGANATGDARVGRPEAGSSGEATKPSRPAVRVDEPGVAQGGAASGGAANRMATAVASPAVEADLFLVYTSSSQGYLEPCGCYAKKTEMGGIARRATFVDSLRTTGTPLLLVEAGDFVGGPGEAGEVIGDVTLKAMKAMGYDAVGLGESELRLGEGFLRSATTLGTPLVHTNWSHPAVGAAQEQGLLVEKDGLKIGLIGVLDPTLLPADLPLENLVVDPPGPAAAAAAASLRAAGADLILVLAHADFRGSGRLAPESGAPDLWVVGHGGKELPEPYRMEQTLLLGSGNAGKRVGALSLKVTADAPVQYANLLYPLHMTVPEQPAIASLVKTIGPEILHRREDAESEPS